MRRFGVFILGPSILAILLFINKADAATQCQIQDISVVASRNWHSQDDSNFESGTDASAKLHNRECRGRPAPVDFHKQFGAAF
jgi:hypothetical protein